MELRFARSSSRHRISRQRAAFVVEHCQLPFYAADDAEAEGAVLFLGPDSNGVPLEIGAIELAGGELLVIHAMRLSQRYVRDYEQVMRWLAR